MEQSNVSFITVDEFKNIVGSSDSTIDVLRNKETGKLFMSLEGQNYRVQADIDNTLPIKVLIPVNDGVSDYDNACLINVDPSKGADEMFSL